MRDPNVLGVDEWLDPPDPAPMVELPVSDAPNRAVLRMLVELCEHDAVIMDDVAFWAHFFLRDHGIHYILLKEDERLEHEASHVREPTMEWER